MSVAASDSLTMSCEANSGELAQPHKVLKSSRGEEERSWGVYKAQPRQENPCRQKAAPPLFRLRMHKSEFCSWFTNLAQGG